MIDNTLRGARRRMLGFRQLAAETLPPHELVSADVGDLLFPAGDAIMRQMISGSGDWELDEAMLFAAHLTRGMTVIDIGAHVGYYTLLASRRVGRVGRVIAIEPEPINHTLLTANLRRNEIRNAETHQLAAWDRTGTVTLARDDANTGDHRVGGAYPGREVLQVASVALDEILLTRHVHAVKVDAQGTDHVALRGMLATLQRCRPVMFVEFWPDGIEAFGDDPAEVAGWYQRLGFRMSLVGAQADFDAWEPDQFVQAAKAYPGGFGTLVFRPRID